MRGNFDPQSVLFVAAIDLEDRVRPDHPLRALKRMADDDLRKLSKRFDAAYSDQGRPSVPPERLIKAMMLQAVYSIRSEAQLVERIDHDLLFRWFLDLRIDEPMFDATVLSHNRTRLETHGLVAAFFDQTVKRARDTGLISDDHFSVDGSLIEAYASIKSFTLKEPTDEKAKKNDDDTDTRNDSQNDKNHRDKNDNNGFKSRNAEVDFHGHKRSNQTHASSTDPDAKLYRKSGTAAQLCHALHALVENRHGLVVALEVNSPLGNSEPTTALSLVDRARKRFGIKPKTVGADKGYDQGPFLTGLEKRKITPHVAPRNGPVGGRTRHAGYLEKNRSSIEARRRMRRRAKSLGYRLSQRCRKKIEEAFGWVKTIAGLARTRLIGHRKTNQQAHIAGAAFNLIRMRNLAT